MSLSHLGRAVSAICSVENTTASAIAAHAGLSHVILSKACAGTRMEARTLHALVTKQPDRRNGLDLLIGHLRDEIERSGAHETEVYVSLDSRPVDSDLRLLTEECARDPQLAALMREMASLVRARPLAETHALAAEDAPESNRASAVEAAQKKMEPAAPYPTTTPKRKKKA